MRDRQTHREREGEERRGEERDFQVQGKSMLEIWGRKMKGAVRESRAGDKGGRSRGVSAGAFKVKCSTQRRGLMAPGLECFADNQRGPGRLAVMSLLTLSLFPVIGSPFNPPPCVRTFWKDT